MMQWVGKLRYCVAGLPKRADGLEYGWASSFQDAEILEDVRERLGDDSIRQVVFTTVNGDIYEDLFISFNGYKSYGSSWYHVYSINLENVND